MNDFPISENLKPSLRKQALRLRNTLLIEPISERLCAHLKVWPGFQEAEIILFYYPFRNEISLLELVQAYPEKQWFLPKVSKQNQLEFYRYTSEKLLIEGRYGVLEPSDTQVLELPTATRLLIFVPGLSFDRQGYRLGYGKGYYDRFLAFLKGVEQLYTAVGMVPEALLVELLPSESFDIPVDALATEAGVQFSARKN